MKIFKFILLSTALFSVSCKKNFLERLPSDVISEKQVFSNINTAEDYVNNIYTALPTYTHGMAGPLSSATDESIQGVDWSLSTWDGNTFNKGAYSPASFPFMELWKTYFSKIRACNIVLQNYDLIPEDLNYATRKSRLKGEVLVLRAYYYFELLRTWGPVPIIRETLNPFKSDDDIFLKRSSIDEVMQFIQAGLDEGAALLPLNYRDRPNNWGRASQMVALAVKSKALLFYASPLCNANNDPGRWKSAAAAAKAALTAANQNSYGLSDSYEAIFNQYFNQEVIWSRPLEQGRIDRESNPRGANGYAHSLPLQELIDSYEMQTTGKLPSEAGSGFDADQPFTGRDPRFYQSILYPGASWKGKILDPNGADAPAIGELGTSYWQKKYCLPTVDLFNGTGAVDQKWVLFRTSELYLNYAEAENESNGPSEDVYTAVNAIRRRSQMAALPQGLTKAAMRERIRRERRVELVFENHRFWDVRRWKIAENVDKGPVHKLMVSVKDGVTSYSYPVIQTRVFDPSKHYWMPIPQTEMDKVARNNPDFYQNPNW